MARLMALMADRLTPEHGALAARLFDWSGDVGPSGASLPLRLAGGLHALRRMGRAELAKVYPPAHPADDDLWRAVARAMVEEAAFLDAWVDNAPQTNELRRAVVLRGVGQWLAARHDLPLELCELGASAGLNLNWDRYAMVAQGKAFGPPASDAALTFTPDWTGPLPPAVEPVIVARRGNDLNPLSPKDDALPLMAYLWPDQPERLARMEAALRLPPNQVDRADAADWLDALPEQATGTCRLICHTVAWQYFPEATAARARARIEALGEAATDATPLAWFGMEADGGRGAGLTLRLWPGNEARDVGRCDFHGRWVDWALT